MVHDQPIEEHYEEFIDPDTEMDVLNKSIEIIGEIPVKQQGIKSSAYISSKKSKVQQTVSLRFDNACGLDIQQNIEYQNVEMDPPPDDENSPAIRSLIEKYRNTISRSEKIRILTIYADSWSRRKIMEKFGCSQRMATQAKHLVLEKGILSTPNPKLGKALPVEITEMIISFYKEDDISRPMLGNKDCFTIEKNGEKIKVQKKLVLSNLKETYRWFKERYPETKIGF